MTAPRDSEFTSILSVMISYRSAAALRELARTTASVGDQHSFVNLALARNLSSAWRPALAKMVEYQEVIEQYTISNNGSDLRGDLGSEIKGQPRKGYVIGREAEARLDALRPSAYEPVFEMMLPHLSKMVTAFDQSGGYTAISTDIDQSTVRVMVLVFFGREETFSIMHLYLEANLRANGGLIDEVVLVHNTQHPGDLAYMRTLIHTYPWYREATCCKWAAWEAERSLYGRFYSELAVERSGPVVWLKLDDDLVYIHDGAIEALVRAKLDETQRPETRPLFVSANVVNHPRLSHIHQRRGLVRVSGDRCHFTDDPWGYSGYADWRCAFAIHESFLEDLETGQAHKWSFDEVFQFHDVQARNFTRWSINAFAMQLADFRDVANDAAAAELLIDDEQFLSSDLPHRVGRPCVAMGGAVMVHYSYGPQKRGNGTDGGMDGNAGGALLARYKAFAEAKFGRR